MNNNYVSHDTTAMRDWSNNIEDKSNDYDTLVKQFYAIVDQFVGSNEFKGGLSEDFYNLIIGKRADFERYSESFRECSKYLRSRASGIESDEAQEKSIINGANPFN